MPAKNKPPRITPVKTPDPNLDLAPWRASKYRRLAAVGIVGVAVAVTVVLALGGKRGNSSPTTTQPTVTAIGPVVLSASGLNILADDLHLAIYWVGPVSGDKYELTRTTTNNVYLRYLPPKVKAGAHQGKYLLVATYPLAGALDALVASANGQLLTVAGGKGGLAAVEPTKPTNVRAAFPGVDLQIEVYDPSAKKARAAATSAALVPVR